MTKVQCQECNHVWSVTDEEIRTDTYECEECGSTDVDLAEDDDLTFQDRLALDH